MMGSNGWEVGENQIVSYPCQPKALALRRSSSLALLAHVHLEAWRSQARPGWGHRLGPPFSQLGARTRAFFPESGWVRLPYISVPDQKRNCDFGSGEDGEGRLWPKKALLEERVGGASVQVSMTSGPLKDPRQLSTRQGGDGENKAAEAKGQRASRSCLVRVDPPLHRPEICSC